MARIDPTTRDFGWLFGRYNTVTRDASYSLVSEVFHATDDGVRIVLLLTLESAGHIFFERIAAYLERNGHPAGLQYFSSKHLDVERNHQLLEEEMNGRLRH